MRISKATPKLPRASRDQRARVAVVIGFMTFVACAVAASYVSGLLPGPRGACAKHCAQQGKQGVLAYHGPATSKPTEYQSDCECR
jgi:hypothetical protein